MTITAIKLRNYSAQSTAYTEMLERKRNENPLLLFELLIQNSSRAGVHGSPSARATRTAVLV